MLALGHFLICILLFISQNLPESRFTEGASRNCARPCSGEQFSRKLCFYEFFVSEISIVGRAFNETAKGNCETTCTRDTSKEIVLAINDMSPGPSIEACLGDTIEVLVHNKLKVHELSIHWHGIRQQGSPHMDGVPMVTQCPILPYGGFRYKFRPETAGTYFYHAHLVSQQGDGVYGSLTVRGPQDDPSLERILLLSSRSPTLLTQHSHFYPPTPSELLVNGQRDDAAVLVNHGTQYLLRLVNADAYNCPILLSASGHVFRVLATDGNLVQSMTAAHAVLFPGERVDIQLKTNQPPGKYLMNIIGLQDCRGLQQEVYIIYDSGKKNTIVIKDQLTFTNDNLALIEKGYNCQRISKNLMCTLDLHGPTNYQLKGQVDTTMYIPFDMNNFSLTDTMTDNRYNMHGTAFYPAYLSTSQKARVAQINGMSFKYPSSPLLSQPEKTLEDAVCSHEKRARQCNDTPLFCECIQIIEVPYNRTVEFVLIDEGFGGNSSHTFHVHGYNASVVGSKSFDRPITKKEVMLLDNDKILHRNLISPPFKDTFVVPNKGYTILRFKTDNLGYWLWEARGTEASPELLGPGMKFLMKVGPIESLPPVPLNFPTCSSNKNPDQIFEEN